jgi:hypothetical protein
VTPVVLRARAAPRALRLHPVDRPTAPTHEVADELAASQACPDKTRAWRRHVPHKDALSPLATLLKRRPYRRHATELHAGAPSQYFEYTLLDQCDTRSHERGGSKNGPGIVFDPVAIRRMQNR